MNPAMLPDDRFDDAQAQDDALARYEHDIVAEARKIVAGETLMLPHFEHVRVLLSWLDGRAPPSRPVPFPAAGDPF